MTVFVRFEFSSEAIGQFSDAVRRGNLALVQSLVKQHPGIEHASKIWMHYAGFSKSLPLIRFLHSRGISLEHRNLGGTTALYELVRGGYWRSASLLLELGANPNVRKADPTSATVLHHAAEHVDSRKIIQDLVRHGADPNALAGPFMRPPLFTAIMKKRLSNARALMQLGVDLDLRVDGLNAYEFAKAKGRHEIAREIEPWYRAHQAHQVIGSIGSQTNSGLRPLAS